MLDGTNYDIWHWKIQYLLNEKHLLEHLMVTKSPPSEEDKDVKVIDTTTMEYHVSAPAYQDSFKKDHKACFIRLYSMHDDLIA